MGTGNKICREWALGWKKNLLCVALQGRARKARLVQDISKPPPLYLLQWAMTSARPGSFVISNYHYRGKKIMNEIRNHHESWEWSNSHTFQTGLYITIIWACTFAAYMIASEIKRTPTKESPPSLHLSNV